MAKRRTPPGGGFGDDLPPGISGSDVREIDTEFYDVPRNFPRVFILGRYLPFRDPDTGRSISKDDRWQKWETETPYGFMTFWYADIAFYRPRATKPWLYRTFQISPGVASREEMETNLDDWIIDELLNYFQIESPDAPSSIAPKGFALVERAYAHTHPLGWKRGGE